MISATLGKREISAIPFEMISLKRFASDVAFIGGVSTSSDKGSAVVLAGGVRLGCLVSLGRIGDGDGIKLDVIVGVDDRGKELAVVGVVGSDAGSAEGMEVRQPTTVIHKASKINCFSICHH